VNTEHPQIGAGGGPRPGERVAVALSGGVDSAVSALLLKEQGFDVRALFMKNWEEDDREGYCAAAEDLAYAERVCERLDIPLRAVNLSADYWEQVFQPFLREHERGRTPNPDVLCNREIKFNAFLDFATMLGEHVATGHYARLAYREGRWRLLKGTDPDKDQSYFLHMVGQSVLARALFPVGGLTKARVRALARAAGLAPHDRKDSTGICFIGERPYREFLAQYLPPRPGPIVSVDGETLGRHSGLTYYTLGQRRGLGIGGRRGGNGEPWYVAAKDHARNALVVAAGRTHPELYSTRLHAADLHWVAGEAPALPLRCHAKIRYRQPDQACRLEPAGSDRLCVTFERGQWAITPGQSVVFYRGEECLGGGIIDAVEHAGCAPREAAAAVEA